MGWAKEREFCVISSDLDCSAILAATQAQGPSVIQIRGQDLSPENLGPTLITVLRQQMETLQKGALLTVHVRSARVRTLPLRRDLEQGRRMR